MVECCRSAANPLSPRRRYEDSSTRTYFENGTKSCALAKQTAEAESPKRHSNRLLRYFTSSVKWISVDAAQSIRVSEALKPYLTRLVFVGTHFVTFLPRPSVAWLRSQIPPPPKSQWDNNLTKWSRWNKACVPSYLKIGGQE